MSSDFHGALVGRERLPEALMQAASTVFERGKFSEMIARNIPSRGGIVGNWSRTTDNLIAEVLVVRDEDFDDTLAWLDSYFAAFVPITQWCRVVSLSDARRIDGVNTPISLDHRLGAWIGAILAECSTQAGGVQNLRDMSGFAALSCSTFAAARSAAIWRNSLGFASVASRHDQLTSVLRDGNRPLSARSLLPIWYMLGLSKEDDAPDSLDGADPIRAIFQALVQKPKSEELADSIARVAEQASLYFDAPELASCANGAQADRVRALDRLSERISSRPKALTEGLMGLGASFVEPGASISSELLRRHSRQFPSAPIWLGAFAGAIQPARLLTDQGGLGRFVAKAVLAPHDLHARPSGDISYEELIRWMAPGKPLKLDIRGMYTRVLFVEILTGVTSTFAIGRAESQTTAARVDAARTSSGDRDRGRSLAELDHATFALQRRVQDLEAIVGSAQASLDLGTKDAKTRRNRASTSRKD